MKTINILFTFIKNAQFLQSEFNCNEKYWICYEERVVVD